MQLKVGSHYKVKSVGMKDAYYTCRGGIRGIIISPRDNFAMWPGTNYAHGNFFIIKGNSAMKESWTTFHKVALVEVKSKTPNVSELLLISIKLMLYYACGTCTALKRGYVLEPFAVKQLNSKCGQQFQMIADYML